MSTQKSALNMTEEIETGEMQLSIASHTAIQSLPPQPLPLFTTVPPMTF